MVPDKTHTHMSFYYRLIVHSIFRAESSV